MWLSISSILGNNWSIKGLDADLDAAGWCYSFRFLGSTSGIENLLRTYAETDSEVDFLIYSKGQHNSRAICTARFRTEEHAMLFMLVTPDLL